MFDKIRDVAKMLKAFGQFENIKKEVEMNNAKHLLWSKTFWTNVVGLALSVGDFLPPKWGLPMMTVANILLRIVTNQPVTMGLKLKE